MGGVRSQSIDTPRYFRAAEWVGVVSWPAAWAILALRSATGVSTWPAAGPLGVLLGLLLADFISGLFHWGFDTWGSESTPLLGRTLVRTFREHHTDPRAITHHDYVETNGTNALAGVALGCAGLALGSPRGSFGDALAAVTFVAASAGIAWTSQVHKWAHEERPPVWVARLQRAGVLLRPGHHAVHHRAPHVRAYCITCGWLDPLLERVRFFEALERAVVSLTGARPRAAAAHRRHRRRP
jgi:ubiquitin-conjugating enzyme E2 variant